MASRSAELEIKLKGAKSIADLETVISEINTELKQVDVNSAAFTELSNQAKKASGSLASIQEDLAHISDENKLDSVAKIGGALAAGLSVATVAASHFGEQSEEAINKAIRTATELTVAVNAIKPIMEALSSTNRKAFLSYVDGFKKSGIAASLFGNTTKIALVSTGIGAFAVAVGLLIANWDAVTKAVNRFIDSIPFLKSIKDTVVGLVESVGSLSNLFSGLGAFIAGAFTEGKDAVEEFNKAVERGKVIEALQKQTSELQKQSDTRERLIGFLEVMGGKELDILNLQRQSAKELLDSYKERQKAGEEFAEDELKRMRELADEIILTDLKIKKEQERLAGEAKKARDKAADEAKKKREKELQDELDAIVKAGQKEREERQAHLDLIAQVEEEFGKDREQQQKESNDRRWAELTEQHRKEFEAEKNAGIEYISIVKGKSDEELAIEREKQQEKKQQILDYVQLATDAFNQISQVFTESLQREIDNLNLQLDLIATAYQERVDNIRSLEALLSETRGEAHDQIVEQLKEERKEQQKLSTERKKIQNELIKAENKKQEAEWRNSLINATIQTAVAIAESLPNVVLAAIVGALGAIQIGTIAANKPEPVPLMAKGGYTGRGSVRDSTGERKTAVQLHENEWVAPRWMVESPSTGGIIAHLEAMRQAKPMADGGFSSDALPMVTPDTANISGLTASALKTALEQARIYVAVTEVRDAQTNVEVIESRTSA